MYITDYQSPVGILTLETDGENLTGVYYEGQLNKDNPNLEKVNQDEQEIFKKVSIWLDAYFEGKNPEINFPYKAAGTEFREQVWNELTKIPYGETVTYGEIAKKLAEMRGKKKMAAQAVGGAVGSNPISIIIPCHRVVGQNNSLTGYGGGLEIKKQLLACEHHNSDDFKE
ncbi:methylated-DNA--[protein]-cysteine S-methyltransferase [Staphylococcus debuckii]|uniref:Methylated-DNA--protein-cysteine methyltransferase n=1 Tax=Staphylococcus debuckii TaxID=2044912 RepID=A0ABU9F0M4_9STAP